MLNGIWLSIDKKTGSWLDVSVCSFTQQGRWELFPWSKQLFFSTSSSLNKHFLMKYFDFPNFFHSSQVFLVLLISLEKHIYECIDRIHYDFHSSILKTIGECLMLNEIIIFLTENFWCLIRDIIGSKDGILNYLLWVVLLTGRRWFSSEKRILYPNSPSI